MKEQFTNQRFNGSTLELLGHADRIIAEFQQQGFTLTVRQLYYQFVSRGLLKNNIKEYKRLGRTISDARLAGLLDWDAIEDRVRYLQQIQHWEDAQDAHKHTVSRYAENLWLTQDFAPEVWVEKDALIGVIERACNEFRCPFFACRGFVSQSAQYEASKRFQNAVENGKTPLVFHLGDQDPSGIYMAADNRTRLALLSRFDVEVRRLALNIEQVEQYNPPPNPVKDKDTRTSGYKGQFGDTCWELDALNPVVIDALIREALAGIIDDGPWEKAKKREASNRKMLQTIDDRWDDVHKF